MKICSNCKINKSLDGYYGDNRANDKKQSQCKECFKTQHKLFRETKHYTQYIKNYRNNPTFKIRANLAHSRWQKSEEGKEYLKRYRQKESYKEYRKNYENEYRKKEYARFRDRLNTLAYQTKKETGSDGTVTYIEVEKLLIDQEYKCNLCKKDLRIIKKHLDHIYPISKGGIHSIKNVQWLCYRCNISKSNKL